MKIYNTVFEETSAIINYLKESKGIRKKHIAKVLSIASSGVTRLLLSELSEDKTSKYLTELKRNFREELKGFNSGISEISLQMIYDALCEMNASIERLNNRIDKLQGK